MKDYKRITHEVPNVVDDGYKINVFTSAGFKVLFAAPDLYFKIRIAQLGLQQDLKIL
jgi:hypothetical protein